MIKMNSNLFSSMNWYLVAVFLITYFICSINSAIEICKRKTGSDIRNVGNGNAESENVVKVLGSPLGFLVLLFDVAKVFISYYICYGFGKLFGQDIGVPLMRVFMIAAILGQCYPIYYSFKGGNGSVIMLTTMFILNHQIFYVCLIAGIIILIATRMTALFNIGIAILFAILTLVMMNSYFVSALIVAVIVIFKHRDSIKRILEGQEEKLF